MAAPKLERMPSMIERAEDTLSAHRNELVSLLSRYVSQGKSILQPHNLIDELDNITVDGDGFYEINVGKTVGEKKKTVLEAIVLPPFVGIASDQGLVFGSSSESMCLNSLLRSRQLLNICASLIGNGVDFLNRHLSSIMFRNKESLEPLLEFLRMHRHKGHVMMLNDRIQRISRLESAMNKVEDYVSKFPPSTAYSEFAYILQGMGFERGWGDTAGSVLEMMHLLSDILQAPDPSSLETFLGRIPMVFKVVICQYMDILVKQMC